MINRSFTRPECIVRTVGGQPAGFKDWTARQPNSGYGIIMHFCSVFWRVSLCRNRSRQRQSAALHPKNDFFRNSL